MEIIATATTNPRIYVACLAAYNDGLLHGAWIHAAQDAWAIYYEVKDMLAASPVVGAQEWAIHDHEGFGEVRLEEYTGLEWVARLAAFIEDHRDVGLALLDYYDGDIEEARTAIAKRYLGRHASLADYVQDVTEETTAIPATLRFYIDWRVMAATPQ